MKSTLRKIATGVFTIALVTGMTAAAPGSTPTIEPDEVTIEEPIDEVMEPLGGEVQPLMDGTGNYYYACVLMNGQVLWMQPGEPVSNCKGSSLLRYINGQHVGTIKLTAQGTPAKPVSLPSNPWCYVSIVGTSLSVMSAVASGGILSWVSMGVGTSGLRECRA